MSEATTETICGPETCPLTAWAGLSPSERKLQRKPLAEKLYRQGFTMEQIATQFGVTHKTISQDLSEFVPKVQTEPRASKRGRKGEGRPKGRATRHEPVAASLILDQGKRQKEVAQELGGSVQIVKTSVAREEGRREMLAELLDAAAAKHFTEKGALRIEDAIRIHQARLNKAFEQVVNAEVRRRIDAADDAMRKHNSQLRKENLHLERLLSQRAPLTKAQFRQMQMLCHPDSSASEQTKATLSQWLVEHERRLTGGGISS